jgi:hypothetical protein
MPGPSFDDTTSDLMWCPFADDDLAREEEATRQRLANLQENCHPSERHPAHRPCRGSGQLAGAVAVPTSSCPLPESR